VVYHGLRYMKHNAFDLKDIMFRVFDDRTLGPDGKSRGGQGKEALFLRRRHIGQDFQFTDNDPMMQWIDYAIEAVGEWLQYETPPPKRHKVLDKDNAPTRLDFGRLELRDHQQLIDCWEKVLAMSDWPSNDKAVDQCPKTSEGSTFSTLKRDNSSNYEKDELEGVPTKKKSRSDLVSSTSRTLRSSVKRREGHF